MRTATDAGSNEDRYLVARGAMLRASSKDGRPFGLPPHVSAVLRFAARLGRSECAVDARRRSLGIALRRRVRPWSLLEDEPIRADAAAGIPATEFAARIGRPADAV